MTRWRSVTLRGAVQGVGLRPRAVSLARAHAVAGTVRNAPGGVDLALSGAPDALDGFVAALLAALEGAAWVSASGPLEADPAAGHPGVLRIEESAVDGPPHASIPPDAAPCGECLDELHGGGRRDGYPFVSCTRCGPRGSVALGAPWDRERTTQAPFAMCTRCAAEYADVGDRRGHAQTLGCPECGPRLQARGRDGRTATGPEALDAALEALRAGGLVAVKGVGGYQLLCDATSAAAVAALRLAKHREARPFAVLFATGDAVERYAEVGPDEREALQSRAAPIVLLRLRAAPLASTGAPAPRVEPARAEPRPLAPAVCAGSAWLGALLPASPLHVLLAERHGGPLVCTSGNRSGEPLPFDDADAHTRLAPLVDVLLSHDRAIAAPLDDSVLRVVDGAPLLLRRARGFAPAPLPRAEPGPVVLALGAHLKSTVALALRDEVWLSAHVGDLHHPLTVQRLAAAARELVAASGTRPDAVACDAHPDYASTRLAGALAEELGVPCLSVGHHAAHVAAVAAEHGLAGPVAGLAWDGLGLGDDGTLWGGELLLLRGSTAARVGALRPFPLPGGEAAVREPRRAALGLLHAAGLHVAAGAVPQGPLPPALAAAFVAEELRVLSSVLTRRINAPVTSSVGRLFDAVAALCGLHPRARFEAEAAMALEQAADLAPPGAAPYPLALARTEAVPHVLDWGPTLFALLADLALGAPVSHVAARFHATLAAGAAALADAVAPVPGALPFALAGGCFQNARLLSLTRAALRARGHEVVVPRRLPPGDGALAVGQALLAARRLSEGTHVSGAAG